MAFFDVYTEGSPKKLFFPFPIQIPTFRLQISRIRSQTTSMRENIITTMALIAFEYSQKSLKK
jgi:hypothetical protein